MIFYTAKMMQYFNNYCNIKTMDKITATTVFESLSSGVRLDVFRLLVKQGFTGMVAGEIASTLNIPPTNLSFHLKAMIHANMLTVEQEGRFQRYRANIPLMLDVITYLTEECCSGRPEDCTGMPIKSSCIPDATLTQKSLQKRD